MNNKHIHIFIFFTLLLTSCAPDHEIRALYEERPCPQAIVFNSHVSCKEITSKAPEPITDVASMTLEESIQFHKGDRVIVQKKTPLIIYSSMSMEEFIQFQKTEIDCYQSTDIVPVKWEVAVFFDYDKSFLTKSAKTKLDDNIWVLKHKPEMNISVRGYTDSRGSYKYNKALAKRRTTSVKKYLIKHGINKERIIIDPIGECVPLLKEITESDMATNRRVEMLLVNENLTPVSCTLLPPEFVKNRQPQFKIDRDLYCSLWQKKMTWSSGLEFTSDLARLTRQDESKLNANIQVLKQFPDFLISIRDFFVNYKGVKKKRAARLIQYIYNYLLKNNIDGKRIHVTKPAKDKSDHKRSTYCVEILLLDHKARPISLITTIDNE